MAEQLFVLDQKRGAVLAMKIDGTDLRVLVDGCPYPDGIVVDPIAGHLYWTNMGADPMRNDGSIERVDLDGRNRTTIIPEGGTFTPKQIRIDRDAGLLYWCDREGMRVMRARLDGSDLTVLVRTGEGDQARQDARNWCVGIALDLERRQIYWTQKGPADAGQGRIFRAGIDLPEGETPAARTDIELLFDNLPEPIDLEIGLDRRTLYWTDRGDLADGNSVNRAAIDPVPDKNAGHEVLVSGLHEAIGMSFDPAHGRMYVTDLCGSIYCGGLDGSGWRTLVTSAGNFTGICHV